MAKQESALSFDRVLMEGIQEMVFVVKVAEDSLRYEFINQAVMDRTELDRQDIGKSFYDTHSHETAEFLNSQYKKVVANGESITYEDAFLSPEKELFYSKTRLTPLCNDAGECTHIVSVVKDITNEKLAKMESLEAWKRLDESRSRYKSLFENNGDAIFTLDFNGQINGGNLTAEKLSLYKMNELAGKRMIDFVVPEDRKRTLKYYRQARNGLFKDYRVSFFQKNGERLGCLIKFIPIKINDVITGFYVIVKDMRELDQMVDLYVESEKNFRVIAENANDVIILINHKTEYLYVSPSIKEVYGFLPGEYMKKQAFHNVHPDDIALVEKNLMKAIQDKQTCTIRLRVEHKTKGWIWSELNGTPVFDEEKNFRHLVMIIRDITLQKEYETKLEFFAYHDSLTGLPNRRYFQERLSESLDGFQKHGKKFAVLLMDIDDFKCINDEWGHEVGDTVIQEFGKRLNSSIDEEDVGARLGGDEFVILLNKAQTEEAAAAAVSRIQEKIEAPWEIAGTTLTVTTSIGIAVAAKEADSTSDMLKIADLAMYEAKKSKNISSQIYRS